jgi:hypothetical protein
MAESFGSDGEYMTVSQDAVPTSLYFMSQDTILDTGLLFSSVCGRNSYLLLKSFHHTISWHANALIMPSSIDVTHNK